MIVKITGFDENAEVPYIDYEVSCLSSNQLDFLNDNLDEKTSVDEDILKIAATGDKRNNKKKKHMNPFRKAKGTIFVCGYLLLLVLFWLYMIFFLFP
mgnify:CR=1 FL=1